MLGKECRPESRSFDFLNVFLAHVVAAFALFLYDWVLTLSDEVRALNISA